MQDSDLMPYGLHKGVQMQYVPAEYLIWLYYEGKCTDAVKKYIEENLQVLETEIERKKK